MAKSYISGILSKATNNWIYFFMGIATLDVISDKIKKYKEIRTDVTYKDGEDYFLEE